MQTGYCTIEAYAQDEFVEKKSRVIGAVYPCKTEEEALWFVEKKKKQYWDASHNVYAYVVRQEGRAPLARCSDDGEPQGTAGRPVLDVLERGNLVDCCVVVTRYFGGTLLGTGGLVRAYGHGAKLAIEAAHVLHMEPAKRCQLSFDYSLYGKLQALFPEFGAVLEDTAFGADVTLTFRIREDRFAAFEKALTEKTNGTLQATVLETLFADMP